MNILKKNSMLNTVKPFIFIKKINKNIKIVPLKSYNNKNILVSMKHFPSATKEWYNSVYTFNKNNLKDLSIANNNLSNIFESYFNFHFNKNNFKYKKLSTRYRRLDIKKIFVSKAEVKHTAKKVIITMFVYNEEKRILTSKIRRLERLLFASQFNIIKNKSLTFYDKINLINSKKIDLKKKLANIKSLILKKIDLYQIRIKSKKNNIDYLYKTRDLFIILKLKLYFKEIVNIINLSLNNNYLYKYYENLYYEAKYKIILEKEIKRIVYYKLLLNLNKSKFEDKFLSKLKPLINKIYKKEIEFNIVNLKNISLDSDIFTKTISLKIKNRKNKLLKVLRRSLDMIKFPSKNFLSKKKVNQKYVNFNKNYAKAFNTIYLERLYNFFLNINGKKDTLNQILLLLDNLNNTSNFLEKEKNDERILNTIYSNMKYKKIAGVRLEAKGRLTRRLTASRSVFKIKWKGSLKNLDSSYKGLSSVMLRGHVRSNLQYSIMNSKTRNGAFGIKGWISGK